MIFLEEKFKGNEFNVVILNDLPFSFLFHIIEEGKLLFAREKAFEYYEAAINVLEREGEICRDEKTSKIIPAYCKIYKNVL